MHLSDQEVDRLCSLNSASQIKLYLVAKRCSPVFVPPVTLLQRAHVSAKRGLVELANLCKRGWLVREVQGFGYTRRVRYVTESGIASDPTRGSPAIPPGDRQRSHSGIVSDPARGSSMIPEDHPRSRDSSRQARASDPDLSLPSLSKALHRPSIPEGVQGEAERREGGTEVRENFLQRISTEWTTDVASVRKVVQRCVAANFSQDELSEFLADARAHLAQPARDAHGPFSGLERAAFPIGAACTPHRFAAWRKRRSTTPASSRASTSFIDVTCACGAQQSARVRENTKAVRCMKCGERIEIAPSEDVAIAELVKRAGGSDS